jgi:RecB family endonuclease NucS
MSEQPLTYESVLALIQKNSEEAAERSRQIDEQWREYVRERKERDEERDARYERQRKETDRKLGKLGGRIGDIVEHMIQENIVEKFQTLGYNVTRLSRNTKFMTPERVVLGEIDLLLVDGNTDILIEVRTTLEITDVKEHIEKMKKYRKYIDDKGDEKPKRYVGAVAGAVVRENAMEFAHKKGMYVIVQSGEAVEIAPLPKNFRVKEW